MRIVHLVIDGDVAGGQIVALQLARASRDRGDHVSFVAPATGTFVELAGAEGFDLEIIGLRRSFQLRALLRLRGLLRREHVDVLHTHTLAGAAIPARIAARMAGVSVVSHMHAREIFRPGLAGRLLRWFDARTARPGPVISVSPQLTESLVERGYDATRISTIPNGIELPAAQGEVRDPRTGLGIAPGTPIVLSVGRLDEAKGQLDLIDAAGLLAERGVPAAVVLVGTDPHGGAYEARLRARVAERGVDDRMVFAGFRSDVGALLDGADVVVLPSHSEGVSLVLLEAMAHARPVVATAVGGTPSVAEDGVSALLVPPRDPSALAAAVERLLTDERLAAELGRSARARVETSFALADSTRRALDLYTRAPAADNKPTRVVILTEIPSPYRIPLFNALAARDDVDPLVLFLAERDPTHPYPFYADELHISWRVLSGRAILGRRWIVLSRGVARALAAHDADVVVVGGWNQPAFWAAALWCRRRRRPLVAWVESTTRDRRTEARMLEAAKRVFLHLCSGFLVPGTASTEYLRALDVPGAAIQVAPNAVDPAIFGGRVAERRADRDALRARLGLKRPTVLSVGRLEHDKGMDVLIEAMRDVAADLVIVGAGSMESALRREAGENVRFVGRVERDDLVDWYAAADVFALASRSDQWGMVLNEAALAGLPLVATEAVGAAHDLIEPGRNGSIIKTGSADELVRALTPLVTHSELLTSAGARSKEIAAAFTPDAWAMAVANLVGQLET
jgi:glycosyltransferase involved in cell wall biosynthesis